MQRYRGRPLSTYGNVSDSVSLMCEGGGFPAFWYGIGKAAMLKDHVGRLHGWSSGAIVATLVTCLEVIDIETILDAAIQTMLDISIRMGNLDEVVRSFLDRLLPADAHIKASARLGIVVCDPTRWFNGRIIKTWESRHVLIECVVASTLFPGMVSCRFFDRVYGCLDGGFSRDLKSISANHVIIRPPSSGFGLLSIFRPVSKREARDLFNMGQLDGVAIIG